MRTTRPPGTLQNAAIFGEILAFATAPARRLAPGRPSRVGGFTTHALDRSHAE